jgi:hypothetical protein
VICILVMPKKQIPPRLWESHLVLHACIRCEIGVGKARLFVRAGEQRSNGEGGREMCAVHSEWWGVSYLPCRTAVMGLWVEKRRLSSSSFVLGGFDTYVPRYEKSYMHMFFSISSGSEAPTTDIWARYTRLPASMQ